MTPNNPKVMIINPPHIVHKHRPKRACFPFSLGYLGAYLRKHGYNVVLLDAIVEGFDTEVPVEGNLIAYGLTLDEIKERIADVRPDVVGLSCIFHNTYHSSLALAKIAKEELGVPLVGVGGTHIAGLPDPVLRYHFVDFMVIGEGEYTFKDFLDARFRGIGDWKSIPGLAFRDDQYIIANQKTNFSTTLDEIPWPARDMLPMERYIRINSPHGAVTTGERTAEIFTSRGCDRKCRFCASTRALGQLTVRPDGTATSGRTLTFIGRDVEDVIAELRHLREVYDVYTVQFEDDNFIADKERVIRLMRRMVDEDFRFKWTAPNGIDFSHLDSDIISWMKQSGCVNIIATIESGDQHTLRHIMHKPIDLKKAARLLDELERHHIDAIGAFIVGMPGETYESVKNTFRFAAKHFLEPNIFTFLPLPGTPAYDECREKGYISENYLDHLEHDFHIPKVDTPLWTAQELERVVRRQYFIYVAKIFLRHPLKVLRRYWAMYSKDPSRFIRFLNFWRVKSENGKQSKIVGDTRYRDAARSASVGNKYLRSELIIKHGVRIPLDAQTERVPQLRVKEG